MMLKCAKSWQLSLIDAPTVYTSADELAQVSWFDLRGKRTRLPHRFTLINLPEASPT